MRMNISVPDTLADEVRKRDVPISAICQRALREEVSRMQIIERTEDILIYVEDDQPDPDPRTWPGFDPAKPHMVYGRHPEHVPGWTLYYEQGARPEDNPVDYFIGLRVTQVDHALMRAREVLVRAREGMEKITVEVGEPSVTVGFTGRWLVHPDPDQTRTIEEGFDAGAYYGLALTRRGRIAVYTAHCNDRWPAVLADYDSLDAAAAATVPADLIALASFELGEERERVIWRDI
jgi:hypothetical protein